MAAARIVFHPGASEDYAAAFAWYYARGTALASDFESENPPYIAEPSALT